MEQKEPTKNIFYYAVMCFVVTVYMLSCAPKAQEPEKKSPNVPTLGSNDVNLIKMHKKPFADFEFSEKYISKSDSELQSESRYLMKIGNIVGDEIAVDMGNSLFKTSEQKSTAKKLSMNDSRYLVLIEQQSDAALSTGLSDTEKAVVADTEKINLIIDQHSTETSQITSSTAFPAQLALAERMISNVLNQIQNTELFPELKSQVLVELSTQTSEQLKGPKELSAQLSTLKTLSLVIQVLNDYVTANQTVLTAEDQASLIDAAKLGKLIDNIDNEKAALAALAQTWTMLDAEERKLHFKTANEKLYDFFRKKDAKDIRCIINENCDGMFQKLIFKFGVYPAIKDYGVDKVKQTLTEESIKSVHAVVQTQSALQISTLGTQIKEKIKTSITEKLSGLQQFKEQFKIVIGDGLSKQLNTNLIPMFENEDFESMFKTAYNQAENLSGKNVETQFVLIEKMLQFMKRGTALTSAPQSEDIKTVLKAVEPRFYVHSAKDENNAVLMRAKDQAWSLMFYSKMIQQLADWKETAYDQGITKYIAQDFVTEFQSDELKKQLFPKAELVGMALSLAAQTLKQMQTEKSTIYLLDNQNNRISIKQYLEENFDSNAVVVHAAVSDLQNGSLTDKTRLSDLTLTIEALSLFYKATEGIENSKSESLKDPTLKTEVLNARKQIRLVIMTIANFISNQMVDKEITLYSELNFQTEDKLAATNSSDYANAIEAMMTAYHYTGIEIYKLTAMELYYSMNRKFYSTTLKFYRESTLSTQNTVRRKHVLELLSAVIGIRRHLGITSQIQFDRIFENWYASSLM